MFDFVVVVVVVVVVVFAVVVFVVVVVFAMARKPLSLIIMLWSGNIMRPTFLSIDLLCFLSKIICFNDVFEMSSWNNACVDKCLFNVHNVNSILQIIFTTRFLTPLKASPKTAQVAVSKR